MDPPPPSSERPSTSSLSLSETKEPDPSPFPQSTKFILSLLSSVRALYTRCLERHLRLTNPDPTAITFDKLKFLAAGKAGVVYGIDDRRVLKEYLETDGGEVERRAYDRLGSHPNIAKLLSIRKDGSLILERGEVLRKICRSPLSEISLQKRLGWLRQAAKGYQYSHDCNIIHADVGCNNMILTREGHLKIIDFEGCSIDDEPADSCYEWFSYRPSVPTVSRRTDIFAFGCAIYEVVAGRPPHHELEASDNRYTEVEQLYANNQFPDVTSLPLGRLIQSCWDNEFTSIGEVLRELDGIHPLRPAEILPIHGILMLWRRLWSWISILFN